MSVLNSDPIVLLTTLFCAGFGLGTVGLINAFGVRWTTRTRFAWSSVLAATIVLGAELLVPRAGLPTVGIVFVGWVLLQLLDSRPYRSLITLLSNVVRSPRFPGAVLTLMGFGTGFGAIGYYEWHEARDREQDNAYLVGLCFKPPVELESDYLGTTDFGTPVKLNKVIEFRPAAETAFWENSFLVQGNWDSHVIRRVPAEDTCNCHGWVFSGGRYWMNPDDVARILKENGYQLISDPKPGDLAIYYSGSSDDIAHTAVVKGSLTDDVLVEGKWGALGVYLHPSRESTYGVNVRFYRSDRKGHVIAGLDRPASSAGAGESTIQLSTEDE
jgi:hypothetical protein